MAARSIGSGTICFGLVSIPFKTYTAASASRVSFNLLHKGGGRLKQQYVTASDGEVVPREDMRKGYEFQKDRFVMFSDEELKALESPRTGELELVQFVPEGDMDPVYFEKAYYLGPDKGGERAYRLLAESLSRTGKIGIGKFFTRGREQLVALRPMRQKGELGICLHELFYAKEVRAFADVETGGAFTFKPVEVELAEKLIAELAQTSFDVTQFQDNYESRVRDAVEKKAQGEAIDVEVAPPKAQIIDLLEALKRSVAAVASAGNHQSNSAQVHADAATTRAEQPVEASSEKTTEEKPGIKKTEGKRATKTKKVAGE
jgi:DNA end-binding protein Ku